MRMIEAPLGVARHSNDPRLGTHPRRQDEADDLRGDIEYLIAELEKSDRLALAGDLPAAQAQYRSAVADAERLTR